MNKISTGLCVMGLVIFLSAPVLHGEAISVEERLRHLEEQASENKTLLKKIDALEKENASLKTRILSLEQKIGPETAAAPAGTEPVEPEVPAPGTVPAKATAPSTVRSILDTLKLKGRFAAGFLKSEQGNDAMSSRPSYSHGSFEVPEAKVQIALQPDAYNTVVMRANLNNATFNAMDYFFVDTKDFLPQLHGSAYTLESRLGRFKLPYGEEMHSNNFVESAVVSNSASNAASYDEGIQLSGKIGSENPVRWFTALSNGNGNGVTAGTVRDNMAPKAFSAKLAYSPLFPLYLSGSVYTSGGLGTDTCDMLFAGMNSRPGGATGWSRTLWEADARWDFEKGKETELYLMSAYSDSRAYIRGAFGQLTDSADGVGDRDANYGFVETLWNFHPKWHLAFRYSLIDMTGISTATLNNVNNATNYQRFTPAIGYRLTDKTLIRVAYDFNRSAVVNGDDPPDDLLMVILSTEF